MDPNVHPNKKEVRFLDEDEIIEKICEKLNNLLTGTNSSRSFQVQTLLPQSMGVKNRDVSQRDRPDEIVSSSSKSTKLPPQKLVRSDHQTQTLDSFVRPNLPKYPIGSTSSSNRSSVRENRQGSVTPPDPSVPTIKDDMRIDDLNSNNPSSKIEESVCMLRSVRKIRKQIEQSKDPDLGDLILRHVFVGVVDLQKGFTMIQHETRLYLIKHSIFCEELFYQLGARQFGAYHRIKLSPPPELKRLVRLAVMSEPSEKLDEYGREKVIEKICRTLRSKEDMLDEYFSLKFDTDGNIESLPMLLNGYIPNLDKLPLFLIRIALRCNWKSEEECFISFLRELAFFHVPNPHQSQDEDEDQATDQEEWNAKVEIQLKEKIFPLMRSYLLPPKSLNQHIRLTTSLPDLYKVFERC